jgi:manganese/zinc/iron transport system permease protein
MTGAEFVALILPPLAIAVLAAMVCALPGNFLLLRRQAMLGDAITHVALPGIVAAFLLTGRVSTGPMMLGAAGAAVVAAGLIEAIRRFGRVEPGAAMGVVFTAMFAAGVAALELSGAAGVHLDVEHALYGNLESLIWLDATGWASLADPAALAGAPPALWRLLGAFAILAALTRMLWKPLVLACFDPGYAQTVGMRPGLVGLGLTAATAVAAVAAFEAVGSVLAIAMLVCPPAAARLITDSLPRQIALSLAFAAASAVVGFLIAGWGPGWFGWPHALGAAGMIAMVSGLILAGACVAGPRSSRLT